MARRRRAPDPYDLAEMEEILRRAGVSRSARRSNQDGLRQWYDTGRGDGEVARFNKLRAHLDKLASYLWSPDGVRFGVHLPPAVRGAWLNAASTARDEFRQTWAGSGADLQVSLALEWSLVYNSRMLKVQQDADQGFIISEFDASDFGVTREDQASLDDQDAMCHWYTLSGPQFRRWVQGHPREEELTRQAMERLQTPSGGAGSGVRLVVSGLTGAFPAQTISAAMDDGPGFDYILNAQVAEPVVELCDIWERRAYFDSLFGEYEDWRVTTVFAQSAALILRRRNPILPWIKNPAGSVMPGEQPFTVLTPRPLPDYLWGRSELAGLISLQMWRESHLSQIDQVITRQLDPSKLFVGVNDFDEAGRAMAAPGGYYGTADASAKMETVKVEVSQESFALTSQIDQMFSEQGGIPPVLGGEQAQGVRSGNNLIALAGIGAGRVRHMALQLESTLSRVATLAFRVLQRGDPQTYETGDGTRFILAQLPPGMTLQVSAHSASPIFAEQTQSKALELHKAGAIDGVMLTELLDPPYRDEIKDMAKRLGEARSQREQQMMELELARIRARGQGLGRPNLRAVK